MILNQNHALKIDLNKNQDGHFANDFESKLFSK